MTPSQMRRFLESLEHTRAMVTVRNRSAPFYYTFSLGQCWLDFYPWGFVVHNHIIDSDHEVVYRSIEHISAEGYIEGERDTSLEDNVPTSIPTAITTESNSQGGTTDAD